MMARFYLAIARMAELVDALVSNTNGAIRAGSIPAPGTRKPSYNNLYEGFSFVKASAMVPFGYLCGFAVSENLLYLCCLSIAIYW